MMAFTGDIIVVAKRHVVKVFDDVASANKSNANRVGKYGRKGKDDAALPYNKRKQPARGANSFMRHQELIKPKSILSFLRTQDENKSYLRAEKTNQAALK